MIPIIIATIIKNATMLLVISVMNSELQLIPIQKSIRIAIPIGLVNRNLSNSIIKTKFRKELLLIFLFQGLPMQNQKACGGSLDKGIEFLFCQFVQYSMSH